LRVGAFRSVCQVLAPNVILHRVFRRRGGSDYNALGAIPLVRSGQGLRTLVEDIERPSPVPPSGRTVVRWPPFDQDELRLEPLRRLNEIDGVGLAEDTIAKKPSVQLALFRDAANRERLFDALEWSLLDGHERANRLNRAVTRARKPLKAGPGLRLK
jgi:hypothetical protein